MFFAANLAQSIHCVYCTRYSTRKTCCKIVEVNTSFCIVSFTFIRFECGSVHMKPASMSRTFERPFSFFRQMASSSRDSGSAIVHVVGGLRNRSQFLQKESDACFGIPSVISTEFRRQAIHKFAELGSIGVPQSAHNTLCTGGGATKSMGGVDGSKRMT